MKELFIRSITGAEERLLNFEVTRRSGVNGEKYIVVKGSKTIGNRHAFSLIQNFNTFIYDDEEYIITKPKKRTRGNSLICECAAIHRAFIDLKKRNHIYEQISGTFRLDAMVGFSLKGSGYTFTIDTNGLPLSVEVENFGDDNSLSLLEKTLEKFGAEYEIVGNHIYVAKEIARYLDNQFRHKFNIKEPSMEIDTENFYTYIKGFGKKNEDGTYVVTAEYRSPLADHYGILIAKPVRDERYMDYNSLFERCKRDVNDSIEIALELTYVQMQEIGLGEVRKGDYVWCILDPFDIDVRIRVMEVEDSSNPNKPPIYRLGTIKKKATDWMMDIRASQRAARKDISDTKMTVMQTKQEVTKVKEDIVTTTNSLQETNKTLSEQSDELKNIKQGISDVNTSISNMSDPLSYLNNVDILCKLPSKRMIGNKILWLQGFNINAEKKEIYANFQDETEMRLEVLDFSGNMKANKSIPIMVNSYTESLPYFYNNNNELNFIVRTKPDSTYNIYNFATGALSAAYQLKGRRTLAVRDGDYLLTCEEATDNSHNLTALYIYTWDSIIKGVPNLVGTKSLKPAGTSIEKVQGFVQSRGYTFLCQGEWKGHPYLTVYNGLGEVVNVYKYSKSSVAKAINSKYPGSITDLTGYEYESEGGCTYNGKLVSSQIADGYAYLFIHNTANGYSLNLDII